MEKVIAVVVSYNRKGLLSQCIDALRNQTKRPDCILVVNNGSTDGTEQWLNDQKDIEFITQDNVGSGGGFNTGISYAYKNGYSWIWCMDDDGHPKEDALENLLKHESAERSLMNCAVINKEDGHSFVWNTGGFKSINEVNTPVIKNIGHPFNGTLIHRAIVERVGLPKATFFLWGDETEYYYRIVKKNNIPVYTVSSSIHYHPPSAFNFRSDWEHASSWKMYYYVRNRFHIHRAKFDNKILAIVNYLFFIAAFAGVILLFQKTNKFRKLSSIITPVSHAFTNNFDATPSSILNDLRREKRTSNFGAFRYLWSAIFSVSDKNIQTSAA